MTEHTAMELMSIQLDADVAGAKLAALRELNELGEGAHLDTPTADALEELILKVTARWWFRRAMKASETSLKPEQFEARRQARIHGLAGCVQLIMQKSGPIDPTSQQLSILSTQNECNALWSALISAGIVSQDTKNDYLDGGVIDLMARVKEYSQKILIAEPGAQVKHS